MGREDLLAKLEALVATGPVVLVGLPGVGKTRVLEAWAHAAGVDPIPLEGRRTLDELLEAILERHPPKQRSARGADALVEQLRRAPVTLALDAIDDLDADAQRLIERIASSGATVIASSRVVPTGSLAVLTVPPLETPRWPGTDAARQSSAARLLIESARRAGALESVDDEAWAHAGTIASQLEGLPLALGVAAAQVRALGLARLAEVLARDGDAEARLGLQENVARSLERLSPAELEVLELGATFADGFTIAELEALAERELTKALATLVSHSLVSARQLATSASHLHYTIHAVVRLAVLSRSSPARREALTRRHALYRGAMAEQLLLQGPSAVAEISRIERSLREAFHGLREVDDPEAREAGAAIAAALGVLLEAHGPSKALVAVIEAAVPWANDEALPTARRAALAFYGGYARVEHIDLTLAQQRLTLAQSLASGGVHRRIEASAYAQLAWLAARYGNVEESSALRAKIVVPPGEAPDMWLAMLSAALDALAHANFGRHEAAREAAELWRTHAVGIGDGTHEAYSWGVMGCIALDRGDVETALRQLDHSIELARRLDARISDAIFRGYRAIALHIAGKPSAEAYADAIERADRTGALLYSGLYRAWEAVLKIQRGEVDEGSRMLDLLIAAASWEMPRAVLGLMRAHVDLADARRAQAEGDEAKRNRSLADAATRMQRATDDERHRMIQLRLVGMLVTQSLERALPTAPAESGLSIAFGGLAVARDGHVERLDRHPTQARLLWALALARLTDPGASIDTATLLSRGWPGESPDARGRVHRLRVALSSLRTAGLASSLEHHSEGYRLDPAVPLTLFAAE